MKYPHHQRVKRKAPNWWKFELARNYKGFGEITPCRIKESNMIVNGFISFFHFFSIFFSMRNVYCLNLKIKWKKKTLYTFKVFPRLVVLIPKMELPAFHAT